MMTMIFQFHSMEISQKFKNNRKCIGSQIGTPNICFPLLGNLATDCKTSSFKQRCVQKVFVLKNGFKLF